MWESSHDNNIVQNIAEELLVGKQCWGYLIACSRKDDFLGQCFLRERKLSRDTVAIHLAVTEFLVIERVPAHYFQDNMCYSSKIDEHRFLLPKAQLMFGLMEELCAWLRNRT